MQKTKTKNIRRVTFFYLQGEFFVIIFPFLFILFKHFKMNIFMIKSIYYLSILLDLVL